MPKVFHYFFVLICLFSTNKVFPQSPLLKDSSLVLRRNKLLIFPIVTRTPETNWAFGLAGAYVFHAHSKNDTITRTSTIPFGALYTVNKQLVLGLGANIFFPGEKYVLRMENSFSSFPDKFWGIGNRSSDAAEERYDFKQFFVNPILLRKVYGKLFLGLNYEYQGVFDFYYRPGGQFEQQQVRGRYDYHVSGVGLVISRDSRNNAYSPDKGSLLQLNYTRFAKFMGSNFTFHYFEIDLRKFLKITNTQVLGLHAFGTFTAGDVPFRNLASMGSPIIMRGYYAGRYRDKNLFAMQGEYRAHVWWRLGVVGFAGLGQVSDDLAHMRLQDFKYSLGGGIRFALLEKEEFNLRVDYGFGNNGNRALYVVVSEAF